jgi:hypothetical protein
MITLLRGDGQKKKKTTILVCLDSRAAAKAHISTNPMNSSLPNTDALGGILIIASGHEVSAKAVDKI